MSEDYDKITQTLNNILKKVTISSNIWSISEIFYELESQHYKFVVEGDGLTILKNNTLLSIHKFKFEIMEKYKNWLSHYEDTKNTKKINYYLSCIIFHTIVGEKRTMRDFWGELIYNLQCFVIGKAV